MTAKKGVLLGFEVGTGQSIYMPLHHLAVFGITQLSGKTTALEALITRSGLRAVAFITKRGEKGFTKYTLIPPHYKPRSDWQFVEGLMNVALGEKVRYEPGMRWAIIKVSRRANSLREVRDRAEQMLAQARRDFQRQVFEKLVTYLDAVLPELERWNFSDKLELADGVNVMDVSAMQTETQHLVIASTIEHVFRNLDHVIIVIPEAWETLPQGKMTPVKWIAQQFIRKGAAIGNYMFLDSQDIGGLDKTPLRQCDNWLMGRMKEAHEVERILRQLLGIKVPAEEIQTLPLGHFYAVIGNVVKKVYVLPNCVPEDVGIQVALGKRSPESIQEEFIKPNIAKTNESFLNENFEREGGEQERLEKDNKRLREVLQKLELDYTNLRKTYDVTVQQLRQTCEKLERFKNFEHALFEILQAVHPQGSSISAPSEITVQRTIPALTLQVIRKPLAISTDNTLGRVAVLYAEGFFDEEERTISAVQKDLIRRGWPKDPRLSGFLDEMCSWGYLRKRRTDRWLYVAAIKSNEARSKGLLKEVELVR